VRPARHEVVAPLARSGWDLSRKRKKQTHPPLLLAFRAAERSAAVAVAARVEAHDKLGFTPQVPARSRHCVEVHQAPSRCLKRSWGKSEEPVGPHLREHITRFLFFRFSSST